MDFQERPFIDRHTVEKAIIDGNSLDIANKIATEMNGTTFHRHFHILYDLRTLLGPKKVVYTEIGTYCGGSLSLVMQNEYETECVSIDPMIATPGQRDILTNNINKYNIHQHQVVRHEKYSNDKDFLVKLRKDKFKTDLLFIDGDHTYQGVLDDFYNYMDFVAEGGFIVFDDYSDYAYCPGVKKAVDHLVTKLDETWLVIGCLPNLKKAYDCLNLTMLNEFILYKLPKNVSEQKVCDQDISATCSSSTKNIDAAISHDEKEETLAAADPIHFGIVMATYCRPNGKTPDYLEISIESVLSQEHSNWDLIIVGDKYEPEDEILKIIYHYRPKTSNKIIYLRNVLVERDHIKNRDKLWRIAGATSMNMGLNYLRHNGYKYYSHMDDDDSWTSDHLSSLADIYSKNPRCVFSYSQAQHISGMLPPIKCEVKPNNRLPAMNELIHSSVTFRCDIIPFDYNTTLDESVPVQVADGDYWNRVTEFLKQNSKYCSIYSSKLTCLHLEEGQSI